MTNKKMQMILFKNMKATKHWSGVKFYGLFRLEKRAFETLNDINLNFGVNHVNGLEFKVMGKGSHWAFCFILYLKV